MKEHKNPRHMMKAVEPDHFTPTHQVEAPKIKFQSQIKEIPQTVHVPKNLENDKEKLKMTRPSLALMTKQSSEKEILQELEQPEESPNMFNLPETPSE